MLDFYSDYLCRKRMNMSVEHVSWHPSNSNFFALNVSLHTWITALDQERHVVSPLNPVRTFNIYWKVTSQILKILLKLFLLALFSLTSYTSYRSLPLYFCFLSTSWLQIYFLSIYFLRPSCLHYYCFSYAFSYAFFLILHSLLLHSFKFSFCLCSILRTSE
jgi:hypothetical protein